MNKEARIIVGIMEAQLVFKNILDAVYTLSSQRILAGESDNYDDELEFLTECFDTVIEKAREIENEDDTSLN